MLLDEIRNIKSSDDDLKKFAVTLGLFFLLMGFLWLWKSRLGTFYWFELAAFFLILAFVAPRFLGLTQKLWMTLALLIGLVMTRVILSIVFYGVMTPISLVARGSGKKFLGPKKFEDTDSYWATRTPTDRKKEECEKQY